MIATVQRVNLPLFSLRTNSARNVRKAPSMIMGTAPSARKGAKTVLTRKSVENGMTTLSKRLATRIPTLSSESMSANNVPKTALLATETSVPSATKALIWIGGVAVLVARKDSSGRINLKDVLIAMALVRLALSTKNASNAARSTLSN